ncbi:MAG: hypothetical protein FJY20_05550 [Bacteroidetes bacterium]|nr:hypothetical protein [Bacteroidota bacterium]
MKKLLTILTIICLAETVSAQDSWKVVLHKKLLLTGKGADEEKNIKLIKLSEWEKSGYLEVSYKEEQPSAWLHSIRFADEQGNELLVKDSTTSTKVSTIALRKTFSGKKQVKIYMVIAPSDPMIMAPARRIHLATLKLP